MLWLEVLMLLLIAPALTLLMAYLTTITTPIYYEDDDPAAPNCQAIIITYYKITDYDYVRDSGCGNSDTDDCPGTSEDCCSNYICSGGIASGVELVILIIGSFVD
jgi:hypothetical protein